MVIFCLIQIGGKSFKFRIMSGDNLHGKQPIKFYSEQITLTKVELLEKHLGLGDKVLDLDEKHKEWSRRLSG